MAEISNQERIMALYGRKISRSSQTKPEPIPTQATPFKAPLKRILRVNVKGLSRELFEYQKEGVSFLEYRKGRAILGDDMGLGKTAQALAYLQLHKEDRPAIIICPSSLKLNWAKEVFMWMEKCKANSVYILSGKLKRSCEEVMFSSSGKLHLKPCKTPKTGIIIVNYDIVPNKQTKDSKTKKMKDIKGTGWIDDLVKLNPEICITDESHYLKTKTAARTAAILNLAKYSPKFIALTGTLIENRPSEAYTVINAVDSKLFPSYWHFAQRYCDPKHNGWGWDFKGASNTFELNEKLKAIMIRRMKTEVLKDLPPKLRSVIPMEIDNLKEYQAAESDLIGWLKKNKGAKVAASAAQIEALARINHLKQICVKGKMEACLNWIENYLEAGVKLVVFTTHTWVQDWVYKEFEDWAVRVDGSVTGAKREFAVQEFQNNPKIRLFVGNLTAAGVGLTLTAASATCTLELDWNPMKHDQAEDRVHRIGQEADSVNAYYPIAQGTIEEDIAALLDEKRKVVTAVLNGTSADTSALLGELMKRLKGV